MTPFFMHAVMQLSPIFSLIRKVQEKTSTTDRHSHSDITDLHVGLLPKTYNFFFMHTLDSVLVRCEWRENEEEEKKILVLCGFLLFFGSLNSSWDTHFFLFSDVFSNSFELHFFLVLLLWMSSITKRFLIKFWGCDGGGCLVLFLGNF